MVKIIETEIDEHIKNDLYKYLNGDYDSHFTPEQITYAIEYSFLLNHTSVEGYDLIFKYDRLTIKIDFRTFLEMPNKREAIIRLLKSEPQFKSSFATFMRDFRISKLLED